MEKGETMTSSLIDSPSCPTDSGISESMVSSGGFEFECSRPDETLLPDLIPTKSDVDNSNIPHDSVIPDDAMISSTHSTFDTEIVYRRRSKKTPTKKAPKKRVSFHEDILKNTKTDNIHIEHGFITYKSSHQKKVSNGRYSWCSEYGSGQVEDNCEDDEESQVVYRNACSDMLDYGQTEVFENEEEKRRIKYDNSGIFEYSQGEKKKKKKNQLYKCECSDSNSSLDSGASGSSDTNANVVLQQAKSNSCECIGYNSNNNVISDNCYYSEPNITRNDYNKNAPPAKKSVWSKEKKPKSSCLKKTKYTNVILPEHDLTKRMKKFNVHQITDQIFDNKSIIGSLKDIFGMAMAERGVPEGSEDLQPVVECLPDTPLDTDDFTVVSRPKPFLSKSLDGVNRNKNKYVHNVDEQLRGAKEEDLYAPTRKNSEDSEEEDGDEQVTLDESKTEATESEPPKENYRNKYILNCQSTVFEHTGVSFVYNQQPPPIEETKPQGLQLKQKLTNMFGVFASNLSSPEENYEKKIVSPNTERQGSIVMESSMTSSCSDKMSVFSDGTTTSTNTTTTKDTSQATSSNRGQTSPKRKHLQSPMRNINNKTITRPRITSPDMFNHQSNKANSTVTLSEEFDDILTITTTDTETDKDLVIVDYPTEKIDPQYLRPQISASSSKTSLINRFLRNVTQKKILEATIKKNNFFQTKLNNEKKLFGNLYVKGVKHCNKNMIEDMNAEIAMEIESSVEAKRRRQSSTSVESTSFDGGVGEICIDTFVGKNLNILRNEKETLMKAFKLYTGYSREGYLAPVLVLLTDKTLYVTDVVRNRLTNKFVLPYAELDVILMSPFGNTVLLSNSARDMQQVLLAGGPYPAEGLVASLEMCARRGGSILPAVGQLTMDHLVSLQSFVRDNSSVSKDDIWKYYAVVNVPAGSLLSETEPLGPYLKGFLMHRSLSHSGLTQQWSVGYFLLKAGVLYLFNDSCQKLPTWAVALAECQGARRALKTGRPHCFELLLRTGSLQLAAPDEYVSSEWLQALVQAASGLFEMQDRHKTLGCSLIMTSNHLITLREDFSSPLRRNTPTLISSSPHKENFDPNMTKRIMQNTTTATVIMADNASEISSVRSISSTPSKFSDRKSSSTMSTPTKTAHMQRESSGEEKSHTNMTSFYGKNSGIELLTCAAIDEMISIKISPNSNELWCILEFSCQEVRENSDDLVVFFSTASEHQRFLSLLEGLWQDKSLEPFPLTILPEEDGISDHCGRIFRDINKSWEPLIAAALGYPY